MDFSDIDDDVKNMYIASNFEKATEVKSDINEHIQALYSYALNCDHIVELGAESGKTSWAFLKGLLDSKAISNNKKTLVSVDMVNIPQREIIESLVSDIPNFSYKAFVKQNTVSVDFGPITDLLFIDSWHVYGHIKRELDAHCDKVKKYIIMHDVEIDKYVGESIRVGHDLVKKSSEFGYPIQEITCGIMPAINEFLSNKGRDFQIVEHKTNNNGLLVLKRK